MSSRLNFEYEFNTNMAQPIDNNIPMRVYFLGDFSGAESTEINGSAHSIIKIDIDNFDDVMIKLSPSVSLPSGEQLTFNELEDFHPDNIFEHAIFNKLRRLKRELSNSATADSAAQEILSSYPIGTKSASQVDDNDSISISKNTQDNDNPDENNIENSIENKRDMFERLLGQKKSAKLSSSSDTSSTHQAKSIGNLDRFLSDLLAPHLIKNTKSEHKTLIIFIDTAIEKLMCAILHSREFQSLEAVWRSVREVIFNANYDDNNQLFYLVNTSRESLESAIAGNTNFVTKLSEHLKNTDDQTYDVLIGNYRFSATNDDVTTLNYLASIAQTLTCQFMGAADKSLIDANIDSLWHQFRQTPQAKHVALSYPSVLLRIPYGKNHDEIEAFTFEEISQTHQHNKLLWGNSAFSCAQLLINHYHSQENEQVELSTNITELPAYVYIENDEKKLQPCAEVLLSEQQLIHINNQGIMVFASFRNKNCIRLFGNAIHAVNA